MTIRLRWPTTRSTRSTSCSRGRARPACWRRTWRSTGRRERAFGPEKAIAAIARFARGRLAPDERPDEATRRARRGVVVRAPFVMTARADAVRDAEHCADGVDAGGGSGARDGEGLEVLQRGAGRVRQVPPERRGPRDRDRAR